MEININGDWLADCFDNYSTTHLLPVSDWFKNHERCKAHT